MMNDPDEPRQAPIDPGLCANCRHARDVRSDKGSRFVFCERSRTDPAFARYPRLPITNCRGFDAR